MSGLSQYLNEKVTLLVQIPVAFKNVLRAPVVPTIGADLSSYSTAPIYREPMLNLSAPTIQYNPTGSKAGESGIYDRILQVGKAPAITKIP